MFEPRQQHPATHCNTHTHKEHAHRGKSAVSTKQLFRISTCPHTLQHTLQLTLQHTLQHMKYLPSSEPLFLPTDPEMFVDADEAEGNRTKNKK